MNQFTDFGETGSWGWGKGFEEAEATQVGHDCQGLKGPKGRKMIDSMPGARAGFEVAILDGTVDERGTGAGALPMVSSGSLPEAAPAGLGNRHNHSFCKEKGRLEKSRMSLFWD